MRECLRRRRAFLLRPLKLVEDSLGWRGRDPEAVAGAVAAVFSLRERAGMATPDALVDFLASKQLLLVLDKREHLLEPVAELVEAVEGACSGVVVPGHQPGGPGPRRRAGDTGPVTVGTSRRRPNRRRL